MATRFDQQVQITQQNLRSGAVGGLQSLAGEFQRFGEQQAQQFVQQQAEKAQQAGREAYKPGEQPKFADENVFLGRQNAIAYNKGLRAAYLTGVSNDVAIGLKQIEISNKDDVAGYTSGARAFKAGMMQNADPKIAVELDALITEKVTLGLNRVNERQFNTVRREGLKSSEAEMDRAGHDAIIAARQGDNRQAAHDLKNYNATVDSLVTNDYIQQEQATEMKRFKGSQVHQSHLMGGLENIFHAKGYDAAKQAWMDLGSEPQGKASQPEWDTWKARALTELNRLRSAKDATSGANRQLIQNELTRLRIRVSNGHEVDEGEVQRVADMVEGEQLLQEQFNLILESGQFAVNPRVDRETRLDELATSGNLDDALEWDALNKLNLETNEAYRKDGLSTHAAKGLIDLEPINYTPEWLEFRKQQRLQVEDHSGFKTSVLTTQEAKTLADQLTSKDANNVSRMSIDEKLGIASLFRGEHEAIQQIAGEGAALFGVVAEIGDTEIGRAILTGQEKIDAKVVSLPERGTYLDYFNDTVAGVYDVDDMAANLQAALAHYAETSGAPEGGQVDLAAFKKSLAIVAPIGEVKGNKIELPRGVSENQFNNFIDNMNADYVASMGGVDGLSDERAARLIRESSSIVSHETDGYLVIRGAGMEFRSAANPEEPFILRYQPTEAELMIMEGRRLRRERARPRTTRGAQ